MSHAANRAGKAAALLTAWWTVLGPACAGDTGQRLVAAGGVITEIVYALGRQDRLVGVDATSQHPPQALREKPNVGYVRTLSPEGLLSLAPDGIIAIPGAGPPEALSLARAAGVTVTVIGDEPTEAGVASRIRRIGAVVGEPARAEALAREVERRFASLASERAAGPSGQRVLFVLSLQNGRALVGGRGTPAAAMIEMAGGVNAADDVEGYKPLSDEGIIRAAPDVVLMMRDANHAMSPDALFAAPAFRSTAAARDRALVQMDGLYLLGFGPRTPDAAGDLMRAIRAPRG